ncbi:ATP-binding protein [Kitasatospora sp. NBC_00240]|uniref:AAA family ATPase n=1 Tax=Kitasatospora sp. NBC_00240 TaxID=2903567 RepID=UPI00224FAC4F|nr:ATP-binding protein [Kitasatospora sp. NBC_00240]MCX5215469.1 ATP-binding protein [Kitasatospora sp. NBC_00240]
MPPGESVTTQTQVLSPRRHSTYVAPPTRQYVPLGFTGLRIPGKGDQSIGRPALIGRGTELAQLQGAAASLGVGRGSAIAVEGVAGVGKSLLLDALAFECRGAGVRVFRGAALPLEQGIALAALSSCMGGRFTERALAALGRGQGASGQVTDRIAGTVAASVRRTAGGGPVAILLDDAQWADAQSLDVLTAMAAAGAPLLVVVATRQHLRGPHWTGIRLGRLDEGSVAQLARATAGAPVPPARLAPAEGIARYVIALAAEADEPDGLPPELLAALLRELDPLPDHTRDLLEVMAVLGPTAALDELATALRITTPEVLNAADEAITHGVLHHHGDELAFRHRLLHRALLLALPATVRTALRLQIDSTRNTRSWERHG